MNARLTRPATHKGRRRSHADGPNTPPLTTSPVIAGDPGSLTTRAAQKDAPPCTVRTPASPSPRRR